MKEATLALRFIGENLDTRSVPIYELGDSLIALQRIVHKAHLLHTGRLKPGARLSQDERMRLSLQIVERRKSSDLYQLAPFLADPAAQETLKFVLELGLGALTQYALQRVSSSHEPDQDSEVEVQTGDVSNSVLVGAIYAETVQITNHIGNIGGIESIDLIPGGGLQLPPVNLTPATQEYVRSIAYESYLGAPCEIVGHVTRLYPNRMIADIKLAPSRYVKVGLDEDAFAFVRYHTGVDQLLRFRGRPRIRLGRSDMTFDAFEADSVELV